MELTQKYAASLRFRWKPYMGLPDFVHLDCLPLDIALKDILHLPERDVGLCAEVSVDELALSVRSSNCLTKRKIHTLAQLLALTPGDLYTIRAMGRTSVRDVLRQVSSFFAVQQASGRDRVPHPGDEIQQRSRRPNGIRAISAPLLKDAAFRPLTLGDEWETFSHGAPCELPLAHLPISAEICAVLEAEAVHNTSDLMNWTWDAARERLGEDAADELLTTLVERATECRETTARHAGAQPCFEARRHLLEQRWASVSLTECGLQPRTMRLLRSARITVLSELLQALNPLHPVLCFDLPAFCDVWRRLVALELRQGEAWLQWERVLSAEGCTASLDDVLGDVERALTPTQWNVLCARFGLDLPAAPDEDATVAIRSSKVRELAEELQVSRERIRRVESEATRKLRQREGSWASLAITLRCLAGRMGGVTSISLAAQELLAYVPSGRCGPEGLCHFLMEMSDDFERIERGIYRLSSVPAIQYSSVIEQALRVRKSTTRNLQEDELVAAVQHSLQVEGCSLSNAFVRACLRADGRFDSELTRRDLTFLLLETLRRIGRPAHFTEIAAWLNASGWRGTHTREQSVHNRLVNERNHFVCVDRGTYGLAEWGLEDSRIFDRRRNGFIADLITECLSERDEAVPVTDIITYVQSRKRCQDYSIRLCLSRDGRFHAFGRGRYGLKKWIM